MKKIICALALLVTPTLVLGAKSLSIGDSMPVLDDKIANMVGVNGKKHRLHPDEGGEKGTLVIFSCNHCPFVKAWEERIAAIGNEFQKKGVRVIQVNSNDPKQQPEDSLENMKKRAADRGFEFPYAVDATSDVARAYGATRTPEIFLFNAQGELVYKGAVDDDHRNPETENQWLRRALERMIEGKPIEKNVTRALGCSIKFREKD